MDAGKLISTPGIIRISDGVSFNQIGEEYADARSYDAVITSAVWNGTTMTMDQIDYTQPDTSGRNTASGTSISG